MTTPTFTVEAFYNEHLPEGGGEVDAIVAVTTTGAAARPTAHVIMVDCSGSMGDPATKIHSARQAVRAAIDALPDGALVAVVAGRHDAQMVFPAAPGMVLLDRSTRRQAHAAVEHLVARGGTAIDTWLTLARTLLAPHTDRVRHGLLLTDGRNEHSTDADLAAALAACDGVLTCDCRGVGTDWEVEEVQRIGTRLLGSVDIVADPAGLAADFAAVVERAGSRAVSDVALRVWTPLGATLRSVKQVSPTVEDLTGRRTPDPAKPLNGTYPTGSWGDETREYHLRVSLEPLPLGERQRALRVDILVPGTPTALATADVPVRWTADEVLSTRLDLHVAHYTGQEELAEAIQEGLDARRAGDVPTATARLGRAVALAAASDNRETAALLERVVEVDDPATGRVRLRSGVTAADEMTLDVRSTRTARVRGPER